MNQFLKQKLSKLLLAMLLITSMNIQPTWAAPSTQYIDFVSTLNGSDSELSKFTHTSNLAPNYNHMGLDFNVSDPMKIGKIGTVKKMNLNNQADFSTYFVYNYGGTGYNYAYYKDRKKFVNMAFSLQANSTEMVGTGSAFNGADGIPNNLVIAYNFTGLTDTDLIRVGISDASGNITQVGNDIPYVAFDEAAKNSMHYSSYTPLHFWLDSHNGSLEIRVSTSSTRPSTPVATLTAADGLDLSFLKNQTGIPGFTLFTEDGAYEEMSGKVLDLYSLYFESSYAPISPSEISYQQIVSPSFGSISITNITMTSASANISFKSNGSTITEKGIVYSTSNNPTTADNKLTSSVADDVVDTKTITGLSAETTYYFRGYIVSGGQTIYSQVKTITTPAPLSSNANLASKTVKKTGGADVDMYLADSDTYVISNSAGGDYDVDVTVTTEDSHSTLKIEGSTATSGSPRQVTLTPGLNVISYTITSEDTTHVNAGNFQVFNVTSTAPLLDWPKEPTVTSSTTSVTLNWRAVNNVTGYRIYKEDTDGNYVQIGNDITDTEPLFYSKEIVDVVQGTDYNFRIKYLMTVNSTTQESIFSKVLPITLINSTPTPTPTPTPETTEPESQSPSNENPVLSDNMREDDIDLGNGLKINGNLLITVEKDLRKEKILIDTERTAMILAGYKNRESSSDTEKQLTIPFKASTDIGTFTISDLDYTKLNEQGVSLQLQLNHAKYLLPVDTLNKVFLEDDSEISDNNIIDKEFEITIDPVNTFVDTQVTNKPYKVVGSPVDFSIVMKTTYQSGEVEEEIVDHFKQYVERSIPVNNNYGEEDVTTAVVVNSDGSVDHIPTFVGLVDGESQVKISSMTNSTYELINHLVTVDSVSGHWSEDIVNLMASKMIISQPESFSPNQAITRGELITDVVKALGLYRSNAAINSSFVDLELDNPVYNERNRAISIAESYGLASGYANNSFDPQALITREEAMMIYSKAMDLAALTTEEMQDLQDFTDQNDVSSWAKEAAEKVIQAGVFNGASANTIAPKETLTQAEAVSALYNLLVQAELINPIK